MSLEKVMEELHVQIIVFDNEYPLGHHHSLPPPPAVWCRAAGDLRRATVKKSITRGGWPGPIFRRESGQLGIFALKKLNNRLTA
jgi:hypothetical protein